MLPNARYGTSRISHLAILMKEADELVGLFEFCRHDAGEIRSNVKSVTSYRGSTLHGGIKISYNKICHLIYYQHIVGLCEQQ